MKKIIKMQKNSSVRKFCYNCISNFLMMLLIMVFCAMPFCFFVLEGAEYQLWQLISYSAIVIIGAGTPFVIVLKKDIEELRTALSNAEFEKHLTVRYNNAEIEENYYNNPY